MTTLLTVAAASLLFWFFLHQISSVWLDVALRPEVRDALEHGMNDQRLLRDLDPARRAEYRKRFEENRQLVNRIDVIRLSREAMVRRFELALVAVFALTLLAAAVVWWLRQRRDAERRRREYVERLASWQEAARRHAHEIRTPLTAARLEADRLASIARGGAPAQELDRAVESVFEELDRLSRFTREFASFAALGQPVLRAEPLEKIVAEFCETFANAWPEVLLRFEPPRASAVVLADRDMLRQVLVNLCTNSAKASAQQVVFNIERNGDRVLLDVRDSGTGIPASVRPRIFDPYVTTRKIGEGMGLGLAISRKILLDHGGDLTLVESGSGGTVFRVTLVAG
ncbi:MAG TPA: ATP-binding protein [Thermoanaerobaculia bacterium]